MTCVYQCSHMGQSHVRVAVVPSRGDADLLVHRVHNRGLATRGWFWYVTAEPAEAQVWVYFCTVGMADLKVCFVETFGEAGWMREHRLKSVFR